MTTVIGGNTVSYSPAQLIDNTAELIVREPLADTTDDFAFSGVALATATLGPNGSTANDGYSFEVTIQNNSDFVITQTATSVDLTLTVPVGLVIPAHGSRTFSFILASFATGAWTVDVRDYYERVVLRETTAGGPFATTIQAAPGPLASDLSIVLPPDNGSAGYFLQTDGAGVTTWAPDPLTASPIIYAYGPLTPATVTSTYAPIVLNVAAVNPDPELVLAPLTGLVSLVGKASAGIYEVSFWAQFESVNLSGSRRASLGCRLSVTPSGGATAEVAGSVAECYLREEAGSLIRPGCGKTILVTLAENDVVALEVAQTIGTSTGDIRVEQCTLVMAKLRPTASSSPGSS
jgi:hypothetical protein